MSEIKACAIRRLPILTKTTNLRSKYVADGIGGRYQEWTDKTPVLISAQTGSGKNYFIEHILIPYIRQNKKRLLLVSNRVAVSLQQKCRIAKLVGCEQQLALYTSKGLRTATDFGCVQIYTYQCLERILYDEALREQLSECDYVVFDEAHYFMSDAVFNGKTGALLEQIPRLFINSVRIYLSATPDDVLLHITEAEYSARHKWSKVVSYTINCLVFSKEEVYNVTLALYEFERDYHYLECRYFMEMSEITERIRSTPDCEKWIVFVNSKSDGKKLCDTLGADAMFLDSDSRNQKETTPTWDTLVESSRFDCRVLICTSVLDNGVNIEDDAVKHIVTFTYDKTELLQMIGRKRVKSGEKVFLYLCEPQKTLLGNHLHSNHRLLTANACLNSNYPQFLEEYSAASDKEVMQMTYQNIPGKHSINPLAVAKLRAMTATQERWIELLEQKGQGCIIKEMLTWVQGSYRKVHWLNYDSCAENQKSYLEFLQGYVDIPMSEDEFQVFAATFLIKRTAAFGTHKSDRPDRLSLGVVAINNRLTDDKVGYEVVKQDKQYFLRCTQP